MTYLIVNPIYIANFLLLTCYTVALWLISTTNVKLEGMRLMAWAYTAAFAAGVVASFGNYDTSWLVHAIAPELLLLCFILLHYTFLKFVGRSPGQPLGWIALLTFGFAGFLYCGLDGHRSLLRAVLTSALLGLQAVLSGYVLLRYAQRDIKRPARAIAVVFLLFGMRSLLRCWWILHFGAMPERMPGWWTEIAGVSGYLLLNAFTPLGYLWMSATRLQSELESLSSTDSLTGALNRRAFDAKGNAEVERALRYDLPISVVAMDVDHFKLLNDTRGHAGGDRVLVTIADAMRSLLRSPDFLARFGGDEFMILLPATGMDGARELAERLRERIDAITVDFQGEILRVHASFGVATMERRHLSDSNTGSWELLLQQADAALYRAKESGRNRVE